MDEEISSLAAAAAAAAATSMAADLWQAMRSVIVRMCRRRRVGRGDGHGGPSGVPVGDSRRAIFVQENLARDTGTVFAVQSGELHFHDLSGFGRSAGETPGG